MSAKRLQRLATIFLAALYGVAGVTGESLHYLATDIGSLWANQRVTTPKFITTCMRRISMGTFTVTRGILITPITQLLPPATTVDPIPSLSVNVQGPYASAPRLSAP